MKQEWKIGDKVKVSCLGDKRDGRSGVIIDTSGLNPGTVQVSIPYVEGEGGGSWILKTKLVEDSEQNKMNIHEVANEIANTLAECQKKMQNATGTVEEFLEHEDGITNIADGLDELRNLVENLRDETSSRKSVFDKVNSTERNNS